MSETLSQVGTLVGHNGWVTSIAFTPNTNEETMNMLVSCSRDKTLLKWDLIRQQGEDYGRPRLLMRGHSNFVQVCRTHSALPPAASPSRRMSSFPPTASSLCRAPGTARCACGT